MEMAQEKGAGRVSVSRLAKQGRLTLLTAGLIVVVGLGIFWIQSRGQLEALRPTPAAVGQATAAFVDPPQVTLSGRNLDVRKILQSFADQAGARLVLGSGVHGTLSIEARRSDLGEVMDNLCTALRCEWKLEKSPTRALVINQRPDAR